MVSKQDRLDSLFQYYGEQYSMDWKLLKAIAITESSLDPHAVSDAGAMGLMQLMPGTAAKRHVAFPYDAEDNLRGACKELEWLGKLFSTQRTPTEKTKFVLASYNGGLGYIEEAMKLAMFADDSTLNWDSVHPHLAGATYKGLRPDYRQIIKYVEKVIGKYEELRRAK